MQVEKHGRAFESIARRYDSTIVRGCEGANTKQRTTNNEQRTTNNEQRTTNNEQRTTNNKQRTTNNKQQTTNNKQRTTNPKPISVEERIGITIFNDSFNPRRP
jgi:hypothetical protein